MRMQVAVPPVLIECQPQQPKSVTKPVVLFCLLFQVSAVVTCLESINPGSEWSAKRQKGKALTSFHPPQRKSEKMLLLLAGTYKNF